MDPLRANWNSGIPGAGPVSYKQFIDRLQYARPTDLTRQQEKSSEPQAEADRLDIHFNRVEAPPAQAEPESPNKAGSLAQAETESPRGLDTREQTDAGGTQEHAGARPSAPFSRPSSFPQPPKMESDLDRMRAKLEASLNQSPSSLLDSNFKGLLTPNHGLPAGTLPPADTLTPGSKTAPQPPSQVLSDTFSAPQSPSQGLQAAPASPPSQGLRATFFPLQSPSQGLQAAPPPPPSQGMRDTFFGGMGMGMGGMGMGLAGTLMGASMAMPYLMGAPMMMGFDPFGAAFPAMLSLSNSLFMGSMLAMTPPMMMTMPPMMGYGMPGWGAPAFPPTMPYGQPGPYAPQPGPYCPDPGFYAPQPGPFAPQPGPYGQPGPFAPQPGPYGPDPWNPSPWSGPPGPVPPPPPPPQPVGPRGVVGAGPGANEPVESKLVEGKTVDLTEAQRAKLDSLAPDRRQAFESLWSQNAGKDIELPSRTERYSVNEHLAKLLDEGRLDDRDKTGRDLLTNLGALAAQPFAPGIDGSLVSAQAVVQTASPAQTMTQGNHGTCAAATIEYLLAKKNPAEYVRVASGLMAPEGRVQMASGQVASRVDDSVPEDFSGRTTLNRVVQASFMNVGGAGFAGGAYSNRQDGFVAQQAPPPSLWGLFGGQMGMEQGNGPVVATGLTPEMTRQLAESALGERYTEVYRRNWSDPNQAIATLQKAANEQQEPVPVSLAWDGGGHRVLVTKVENGRVYFRNPWGERTGANQGARLFYADHDVHGEGLESVSVGAFQARLNSMIIPSRLVGGGWA